MHLRWIFTFLNCLNVCNFRINLDELALLMAYDAIDAKDAALILLEDIKKDTSGHKNYERFRLSHLNDQEFVTTYRFQREHIKPLVRVLRLEEVYQHPSNGIKWSTEEGLCLLLQRLAYPNRLVDLVPLFGRHKSELSLIINSMAHEIYHLHRHRLERVVHPWVNLPQCAEKIHQKGACMDNIWGFLDGTQMRICRPVDGQESVYNGHKRQHSLKFQSVMLPNGVISHFYGPFEGRRHDSAMYFASGLDPQAEQIFDEYGLSIYADSAYAFRRYLITPFKGAAISKLEHRFNKNMAMVRGSVEWGFGKIGNNFAFLNFHKNIKVYLQPVAKLMFAAVILTNAHTCLYSSQTSKYFSLEPPSLEEYFY